MSDRADDRARRSNSLALARLGHKPISSSLTLRTPVAPDRGLRRKGQCCRCPTSRKFACFAMIYDNYHSVSPGIIILRNDRSLQADSDLTRQLCWDWTPGGGCASDA